MLSIILQIGGLWNIVGGITRAVAASHHIKEEQRNGKFDFWYL